ncbi:hypothetical protein HMPREF3033_00177 [Veillonellaceae bacterium DNF00751]|nr:hypothetical protein HMPREF3033_00177 [Veillonellaceae bacterium DNF00751]
MRFIQSPPDELIKTNLDILYKRMKKMSSKKNKIIKKKNKNNFVGILYSHIDRRGDYSMMKEKSCRLKKGRAV